MAGKRKASGPFIDIDMNDSLVRLLRLDRAREGVVYVCVLRQPGGRRKYRFSWTPEALLKAVHELEDWDGHVEGEDYKPAVSRVVQAFLKRVRKMKF